MKGISLAGPIGTLRFHSNVAQNVRHPAIARAVYQRTTSSLGFRQRFSSRAPLREAQAVPLPIAPTRSLVRRALSVIAIAVVFTTAGFALTAAPAFKASVDILNPPTSQETISMFKPEDKFTRDIEDFIQNHPLTRELRSKLEYIEGRPHFQMPPQYRLHNLTSGTLLGPERIAIPPLVWREKDGKSMVSITYLGTDLCGHPGLVHGGLTATLLDEGLVRCSFAALPNKIALTANLNINYRAPIKAGQFVVLRATTTKVEGRKAWVEGRLETLAGEGETPVVLAEATALAIEPKQAAMIARVYTVH